MLRILPLPNPLAGAPKAGNPLPGKLYIELSQGANVKDLTP